MHWLGLTCLGLEMKVVASCACCSLPSLPLLLSVPVGELFQPVGFCSLKLQVPVDSPGGDARPVEVELAWGPSFEFSS